MRRLVNGSVGAVVAVAWIVSTVMAQVSPWQLVKTGDGTLYVIAEGVRHRIVPAIVSDAAIRAIPEAEPWDAGVMGAGALNALQASLAAQPAGGDAIDERCMGIATGLGLQHSASPEVFMALNAFCRHVAQQDGERGLVCFEWTIRQGMLLMRDSGTELTERMAESLYTSCVGR